MLHLQYRLTCSQCQAMCDCTLWYLTIQHTSGRFRHPLAGHNSKSSFWKMVQHSMIFFCILLIKIEQFIIKMPGTRSVLGFGFLWIMKYLDTYYTLWVITGRWSSPNTYCVSCTAFTLSLKLYDYTQCYTVFFNNSVWNFLLGTCCRHSKGLGHGNILKWDFGLVVLNLYRFSK